MKLLWSHQANQQNVCDRARHTLRTIFSRLVSIGSERLVWWSDVRTNVFCAAVGSATDLVDLLARDNEATRWPDRQAQNLRFGCFVTRRDRRSIHAERDREARHRRQLCRSLRERVLSEEGLLIAAECALLRW